MGPSLRVGKLMAEYGMETPTITLQEKVQNPTIRRKPDACSVLVFTRPSTGTLSGEGHNNKQYSRYSGMHTNRLKPAIRSKRRGLLSKGVVLLHDKARPHTAAHNAETLRKLKFQVMAHPPYSPDLVPFDYHLFGPIKEALSGRRFISDQEVKEAGHLRENTNMTDDTHHSRTHSF